MFIIKLLNKNKSNKVFQLNNSGIHYRDFTSINDIVLILEKLSSKGKLIAFDQDDLSEWIII